MLSLSMWLLSQDSAVFFTGVISAVRKGQRTGERGRGGKGGIQEAGDGRGKECPIGLDGRQLIESVASFAFFQPHLPGSEGYFLNLGHLGFW